MNVILIILGVLVLLLVAVVVYLKKVPHGWVEVKTGIILKILPDLGALPPVKLRKSLEDFAAKNVHKVKVPISKVEDLAIPTRHGEVAARLYHDGDEKERMILFIHGGGFCVGSIDTHNEQARRVAKATQLPTLSINYHLAPEHKFPVPHDQCLDAAIWACDNHVSLGCSQPQLITMGDSAGGNLAIATALAMTQNGHPNAVKNVVAIYPATDAKGDARESMELFSNGYYLTDQAMNNFIGSFISKDDDRNDPRLSVIDADLSDFPPTFVLTAAFDPLRDEGEEFAGKLTEAGRSVVHKRYENAIHAFFGLKDFGSRGIEAVEDVATYLRTGNL